MAPPIKNPKSIDYTLIALMFVLMLLLSPLIEFWAALDAPWYSPYLVWLIAIFVTWFLQRKLKKYDL